MKLLYLHWIPKEKTLTRVEYHSTLVDVLVLPNGRAQCPEEDIPLVQSNNFGKPSHIYVPNQFWTSTHTPHITCLITR